MATPTNRENMVKMNMYLPKQFKDWLESESIKTGLTQTALVHMALKTYMDQQKSMDMLPKLMKVMAELKGQDIDPKEMDKLMLNIAKALEE
jgi:hypothetical protein